MISLGSIREGRRYQWVPLTWLSFPPHKIFYSQSWILFFFFFLVGGGEIKQVGRAHESLVFTWAIQCQETYFALRNFFFCIDNVYFNVNFYMNSKRQEKNKMAVYYNLYIFFFIHTFFVRYLKHFLFLPIRKVCVLTI